MICRINVALVVVRLLMICLKRRGDRYYSYSYTVVTHHGSIVVLYQLSVYLYLLSTNNICRSRNLLRYICMLSRNNFKLTFLN